MNKFRKTLALLLAFIFIFTSNIYANSSLPVENDNVVESGYTDDGIYYEISEIEIDSNNESEFPKKREIPRYRKDVYLTITFQNVPKPYSYNTTYYYISDGYEGPIYANPNYDSYYHLAADRYSLSVRYAGTVYCYY